MNCHAIFNHGRKFSTIGMISTVGEDNDYYKGNNFIEKPCWVLGADSIRDTGFGNEGDDYMQGDSTKVLGYAGPTFPFHGGLDFMSGGVGEDAMVGLF